MLALSQQTISVTVCDPTGSIAYQKQTDAPLRAAEGPISLQAAYFEPEKLTLTARRALVAVRALNAIAVA